MNHWQVFIEALRSLNGNRLRSALTMLGVIIGIGSVTLMLGIGDAVRRYIDSEMTQLGSNQLLVQNGAPVDGGAAKRRIGEVPSLTLADARAVAALPSVLAAAPGLQYYFQVNFGEDNVNQAVLGTTPAMFSLRGYALEQGAPFDERDVQTGARVVVIGSALAQRFYAGRDPLGQSVRLDGQPFTVVGVLAGEGRTMDGAEQGELILAPITALPARSQKPGAVHYISVIARGDGPALQNALQDTQELLRDRHRISPDRRDDFTVTNLASVVATAASIGKGLSVGLGAIGAISLLVGGIGIMNIMLVSVSERVREIGIRVAIGARPRDLMRQFLGESVVLCLLGGLLGLMLAALGAFAVSTVGGFPMSLAPKHALVAVGFSSIVGLFFGYYPARRASRLLPIECLRQD